MFFVNLQNKSKGRAHYSGFYRRPLLSQGRSLSGGDVLRHALKNELAKISLCGRNIEASAPMFDYESFQIYIGENAKNIQISANYLLNIIKRIHDFTEEIALVESAANLIDILEDAIHLACVSPQTKKITLIRHYSPADMNFFCIAI